MTFFNWKDSDTSVISRFFWVYVLFTVSSTMLTVGSWWYFVIYRPKQRRKDQAEDFSVV